MDIQNLRVSVSEQELNELLRQRQPPEAPVKNLSVRVTPEGVRVAGEVSMMMMTMGFESLWRPEVVDGKVAAHLVGLTAAGFPATALRRLVLDALKDALKDPAVQITEEAVVVDVQELVRREKLPINVRFEVRAVRCIAGGVVAEAGLPDQPEAPAKG